MQVGDYGKIKRGFYVFFQHAPFFRVAAREGNKIQILGFLAAAAGAAGAHNSGRAFGGNESPRVVKANQNHKHFNTGKGPPNELAWPSRTNGSLFFEGIPNLPRISIRATARNESSLSSRFQVIFFLYFCRINAL